jgi:hypothetical protein
VTRPHWAHHHSQPGYPHETQTHKESRNKVATQGHRHHSSTSQRLRLHRRLPGHSFTNGAGVHAGPCHQLATRAKDRQLQIRRRASQGNYVGLAPTEHTADHPQPVIVATETPHLRLNSSTASRRTHRTRRVKPTNEAPPRPIFRLSHHLRQTVHLDLTQQPDSHQPLPNPDHGRLQGYAPNGKETQQHYYRLTIQPTKNLLPHHVIAAARVNSLARFCTGDTCT